MGQAASSPPAPQPTRRRSTLWSRSSAQPTEQDEQELYPRQTSRPTSRRRPSSINRLSQFLHSSNLQDEPTLRPRPSRLQRARTSLASLNAPTFLSRQNRGASRSTNNLSHLPSNPSPSIEPEQTHIIPLDVQGPDLDLDFSNLTTSVTAGSPTVQRPSSRRSSLRIPNSLSDRFASLRPHRGGNGSNAMLRRRRSPLRHGEDNTALLSRLLSVAAAATAATLLEGNEHAMADARGTAGDGDDGTFDSFLQSLENGRLASALRQGGRIADENGAGTDSNHAPLNFFRMFRFGSSGNPAGRPNPSDGPRAGENGSVGRMVPIIIVGIRAVSPGNGTHPEDTGVPPFLDALSTFPTAPFGSNPVGHDTIDNILRPPHNGTRFSHRRRASMGGLATFPSDYDAQRHHRSPERTRPRSVTSEASNWPRPPPVTPASQNLSRVTSGNTTPARSPTSRRSSFSTTPRRESIIRTTTTTTLETTSEDAPLRPRTARQRRLSESDFSRNAYASRRNGIVEPDNAPPRSENTRSWIIYVLGGSYPENHPILTTPSLFTDSPTYEDMMLLSALLGPAKPPVASESDVADAGGVYTIQLASVPCIDGSTLMAVSADGSEKVALAVDERCLVCLCDFEKQEEARRLAKCGHLFHRECIDEWLTKGRNSCPLCRAQGVDENDNKPEQSAASTEAVSTAPAEAATSP